MQVIRTNGSVRDLAMQGRTVYVSSDSPSTLSGAVTPYDAVTTVKGEGAKVIACSLAAGDGYGIWAADCPHVTRMHEANGRLTRDVSTELPQPQPTTVGNLRQCLCDLAVGLGAVWVLGDAADPRLWKLDRTTARIVAEVRLPFVVRHLAVGDDAVWVTDELGDRVVRIDPSTLRQTDAVPVGRGAEGVVAGAGRIWVANAIDGTVSRVDPEHRRVDATIAVGGHPEDLAVADGTIWVAADGA